MSSIIYDLPTVWSFIIFVFLVTILSLLGLYLVKLLGLQNIVCKDNNTVVGIFLGVVAVFLSVLLSFLIVTVWNRYSTAQTNADQESQALYLLYQTLILLPGTETIRAQVIQYLEYIINVEYPNLKQGILTTEGTRQLERLQQAVYGYNPTTTQESILYNEAIDWLNTAIELRIDRINSASRGVYDVIWWVNVIDAILVIILIWFVSCCGAYHYLLTAFTSIYVSSALYLALILTYPFLGYAGLTAEPFEVALFFIQNPST